jgi:hypothetical protein
VRCVAFLALAVWLGLVATVSAQSEPPAEPNPDATSEESPATGPLLVPSDAAPLACDPAQRAFRFVEVRGSGFEPWATQRLVGTLVDAQGQVQIEWGSVWISPTGRLTLEVNLCGTPFRGRPALPVGGYTIAVGPNGAEPVATASIDLREPPAAGTEVVDAPAPAATPFAAVLPNTRPAASPKPRPTIVLPTFAPTPTSTPRTGVGTRQQPYPAGASGSLSDDFQLLVQGVTPDAYDGIKQSIPSSVPPGADQRYLMVRVEATYRGQGSGVFSTYRLGLFSPASQTSYDQLGASCGLVPGGVPTNLLTSGGVVRGNICFAIRTSDIPGTLLVDRQAADNDRRYFALE